MTFQFPHPVMNWNAPDQFAELSRFKEHCQFIFNGPLSGTTEKQKCGWVGTWIGEEGREIYKTLQIAEGVDDVGVVFRKFEEYVRPKKNKRLSRHKLKNRKQTNGETFTNYVKDLKVILMDCEYENPEDILIDCIIDGVADAKLQEKLLDRGEGLTLTKALELGQQHHESKNQLRMLREEVRVDQIQAKASNQRSTQRLSQPVYNNPQTLRKCGRCGRSDSHRFCPAVSSVCAFCKRKGHWQAVCRNKNRTVNQVHVDEESDDLGAEAGADLEEVLHIYTLDSKPNDRWTAALKANNTVLQFRIDTGAKCNVMQKSDFDRIKGQEPMETSKTVLKTYSNNLLKPIGQINIKIQGKKQDLITAKFQIVDMKAENIISGDLAEALGLIEKIDNLQQQENKTDLDDYPEVTRTTGLLPGVYKIKLEEGSTGVVHACRKFPPALKDKITAKLLEMERDEFIERVHEPTEWVNSMVVAMKNEKIRICLDPKDLNKVIKREHHPMRSVEEVTREIPNATVFSKLDAKSGFLQIKLDEDSSKLTTFNTPLGRYKWLRLPFGLKCSPEIFQKIMDQMLEGIDGAFVIMDDILIAGTDLKQHDEILKEVLRRATDYNLKLNMEKVRVRQKSVEYCGHIISAEGLRADPEKIKAVREMPKPHDKESLRRFLGFVTYLGKFIPNLSQVDQPLRQLLKTENIFQWEDQQEKAFNKLKDLCVKAPVLQYFDVNKPVEVHCDASSTGLGAVLVQDNRPVAYSSRALTDTETRYAQIEKEMLAIVHACKKFHCFIFGKEVTVFTDHKPLELIFKKQLLAAPMRLQRMLLALQWYDITVTYRKGKDMQLPDTLSRAYLQESVAEIDINQVNASEFLSITEEKYRLFQVKTEEELKLLHQTIQEGWPEQRKSVPRGVQPYFESRGELNVVDGIIFKSMRIVVPPSLRTYALDLIHKSHMGIVKCKQRGREVFFWPNMNAEIEQKVRNCELCAAIGNKQPAEPLKYTLLPNHPFAEIAADIFEFESVNYLVTVDYYSSFIQTAKLNSLRSFTVIEALKQSFSVHGIPNKIRTDCGTQFTSQEFQDFCQEYNIQHHMVSPHHQSANGKAERAVQIVKRLWHKCKDKYLAILDFNTTPLENVKASPAQLLMGRRPRNLLPAVNKLLQPRTIPRTEFSKQYYKMKETQKFYHDRTTRPLHDLPEAKPVRLQPTTGRKVWLPGAIVKKVGPRSYIVETGDGVYKRNRRHIRTSTEEANRDRNIVSPSFEETEEDAQVPLNDNSGRPMPNTPQPQVEVAPSPTPSELSNSLPLTDNVSLRAHPDNPPYTTRSGRQVRKPNKFTL